MACAKRVLLVEDDLGLSELLTQTLEGAGYKVRTVANRLELLAAIGEEEFDVVVLDLDLASARFPGVSLLSKIRSRAVSPPVLALSGHDAVDDRVRGLNAGADDYLCKPFAFVELLARVRALLRRGQAIPERLQVGELALDCVRRRVTRGDQPIDLGPKEFSILEILMRNHGRVLSRNVIVQHVWDHAYSGYTNIVDVYIRHLRQKVDDGWARKMIRTVRGTGYLLANPDDR